VCTVDRVAIKTYGLEMAIKISQRIQELRAADNVDFLINNHIGRCHALIGNLAGHYAMDLVQPHRLLFTKDGRVLEIESVKIMKIEDDYH